MFFSYLLQLFVSIVIFNKELRSIKSKITSTIINTHVRKKIKLKNVEARVHTNVYFLGRWGCDYSNIWTTNVSTKHWTGFQQLFHSFILDNWISSSIWYAEIFSQMLICLCSRKNLIFTQYYERPCDVTHKTD